MTCAALLAMAVWSLVQSRIDAATQDLAADLHNDYREIFSEGGQPLLARAIEQRLAADARDDLVLVLAGPGGKVIAGNLASWPPTIKADGAWQSLSLFRKRHNRPEPIGLIASRLENGSLLLTGRVIEDRQRLMVIVAEVLALSMALAAILAAGGAACTVWLVNNRVEVMLGTSEAVASGRLDDRVPLQNTRDPFERLGLGMNAMLDQLEHYVTELRLVTDGMAHDLRMPLMRLATHLEDVGQHVREAAAQDSLDKADIEVRHLLRIVSTALEIGRIEAGLGRERFEPVPLAEVLEDLAELYGPVAEERGFALEVHVARPVTLAANRQLLNQALGNLLENALKYAPGGPIRLTLDQRGGEAMIGVEDRGPGIPAADRERALQRFGRLDPARRQVGAGLGLSLVQSVARLHGGRLRLEDAKPGLRALLFLASGDPARS